MFFDHRPTAVWDICDDLIFRKVNESDATAFAKIVGCCPPQVWGVFWLAISLAFFAAGIIVGIVSLSSLLFLLRSNEYSKSKGIQGETNLKIAFLTKTGCLQDPAQAAAGRQLPRHLIVETLLQIALFSLESLSLLYNVYKKRSPLINRQYLNE